MSDHDNNLVAAGAVLAILLRAAADTLEAIEVVPDAQGNPTNQIDISLSFMRSPYRLTIERVT